MKRICLTGPESTGKTALAERAARELGVSITTEYARAYAEARGNGLTAADVEPIARGEMVLLESDAALLDTDLLSTVVYARHYYGSCPAWIEEEARRRRADLYLLMDTDLAWMADPARDTGGDAREDLFDAFRAALDEFGCRWRIVSGDTAARWAAVCDAIRSAGVLAG